MNEQEVNLNRDKILNRVPLPENMKLEEVKPRKPREVKPWKPTPGTLTYYIMDILRRKAEDKSYFDHSMHYIEVTNRLRGEYDQNVDYKNVATLLYNLAKQSRIRKSPLYKGRYEMLAADVAGPVEEGE